MSPGVTPRDPSPKATSRWVVARRTLLAALLLAAAVLLVAGVPEVCHGEATDAGAVQVCGPLPATDVRALLFLLVVALLLLPEVSELEFAGLVSLKRQVEQAQSETAEVRAGLEQLRQYISQHQTQNVSFSIDNRQAGTGAALASAAGQHPLVRPTADDEVNQLAYQAGIIGLAQLAPADDLLVFLAATRDPDGLYRPVQVLPADGAHAALLTWLNTHAAVARVSTETLDDGSRYVAAIAGEQEAPLGALLVHAAADGDADTIGAYLESAAAAYAVLLRQLLGEQPQP